MNGPLTLSFQWPGRGHLWQLEAPRCGNSARMRLLPKLTVRVRFPSPAPRSSGPWNPAPFPTRQGSAIG